MMFGNKSILFSTVAIATLAVILFSDVCMGDTGESLDSGNICWLLVCSALVFMMSPGVAFFYGGMMRKQSMSSIMVQTVMVMGVMVISWVAVGYSIAFSGDVNGIVGNLDKLFFLDMNIEDSAGVSEMGFATFQMTFSLVTAVIVLGACIERVRFNAIILFVALWSILVYAPMAHWVWGGGLFDQNLVVLDFAGGTVVHICAATSGLALALFVGKRSERIIKRAHNIPMVFLGFAILWCGWFGFNGGSGLAADGLAINVILVTIIAPAAALISWAVVQIIHTGHTSTLGLVSGALAGMVAITPAAGFVGPGQAMVIGIIGGVVCYFGVIFMRTKSGIDDAMDVFGVHGIGGIWGAIATGIFAVPSMVGPGYEGLIYGGTDLFIGQFCAIAITIVFCFAMSYAIIWVISKFMRVRLTENEEAVGADICEHGEPSYNM